VIGYVSGARKVRTEEKAFHPCRPSEMLIIRPKLVANVVAAYAYNFAVGQLIDHANVVCD
jgi:hypothetical protein